MRLANSLLDLGTSGISILEARMRLISLEFQEEKIRVTRLMMTAMLGASSVVLGLISLMFLIFEFVPEGARWIFWACFTVFFVLLAIIAMVAVRFMYYSGKPPFSSSINELRKDSQWIKGRV